MGDMNEIKIFPETHDLPLTRAEYMVGIKYCGGAARL